MNKKKSKLFLLILISGFAFVLLSNSIKDGLAQDIEQLAPEKGIENNVYADENEQCFRCHGEKNYVLKDTIIGLEKKVSMCLQNRVERDEFYNSVHWSFSCFDCHSDEYLEFPHAISLRFEEYWTCMDCHGYDENFAQYKFEEIDEDHAKSVHFTSADGDFSCWNCHDPHSYKLLSRENKDISEVILESNKTCLDCHGSEDAFGLLSTRELGNVVPEHEWLPNQSLHFKSVRCIECHSQLNDSLLIAHNVMPSDSAVRNCVECHTGNSILMGSLYKFQSKENRSEYGFRNGTIIKNNSYVIGANRSRLLNIGSIGIFGLTLLVMGIHVIFRIRYRK